MQTVFIGKKPALKQNCKDPCSDQLLNVERAPRSELQGSG